MPDHQLDPYSLGTPYEIMPTPSIPEHCLSVPVGAVTLVVEARDLAPDQERALLPDDYGASLHVLGASDGVEYLRFDCFDNQPHYHYIHNDEQVNVICRLDDVAEGDPIEWTVSRLRDRLPEMLEHAGATSLANAVRSDKGALLASIDSVQNLLEEAHRRTIARRASGASLAPPVAV